MENARAIYVSTVQVTDPHTGIEIDVDIYKDEGSGAMLGLDATFMDGDGGPVFSPYNQGQKVILPDEDDEDE